MQLRIHGIHCHRRACNGGVSSQLLNRGASLRCREDKSSLLEDTYITIVLPAACWRVEASGLMFIRTPCLWLGEVVQLSALCVVYDDIHCKLFHACHGQICLLQLWWRSGVRLPRAAH